MHVENVHKQLPVKYCAYDFRLVNHENTRRPEIINAVKKCTSHGNLRRNFIVYVNHVNTLLDFDFASTPISM